MAIFRIEIVLQFHELGEILRRKASTLFVERRLRPLPRSLRDFGF